ncbi:manganese superoxide dismutase [Athelia psychrophila]|uniref:Superoxide dismutase n=1 Tax=Athelia psychrophila TaxID=1759441 RepID=A0A166SIW0_9AGAM|nr:manganese superoxide dismutase [Fibularhizoctonia sp. CBS 109695]
MLSTIARSTLPSVARLSRSLAVRAASVHTLPELPYAYDALEPHISKEIMTLHHSKHHQAYVTGLNAAEETYAKTPSTVARIALQAALKFNGGGHINHSLFWKNLAPASSESTKVEKAPKLAKAIEETFGSLAEFKKTFNAKTAGVQGSGWGWLGYNESTGKLEVVTTPNQDPLISHVPIIGIDIWEHAFYLQYKNVKPDYLNAIWNIVNFEEAEKRFLEVAK